MHFAGRTTNTIALVALLAAAGAAEGFATTIDFNRDVRTILSDKCFACHGPDAGHREADLRLDEFASMVADRGGYQVVRPGDAMASELIARITSDDPDLIMPPSDNHKPLTDREVRILRQWVDQGARFSLPWAYVAPQHSPAPPVVKQDWPHSWIDQFVLARLEAEQLPPSPDAEPVTLIRRLSFDLTGLPPTAADVQRYADDPSLQTYEALVDQYLASPRFGERMATYWLDLVRFSDTVGYHGDQNHHVWPYRDYVIHAFNANLPFNQFTIEQLAGDLLPDPTADQRIATAYNRLLQTTHEGGLQLKEYRAIYMADRVRNVSQVWMAATAGCAQCHDHKFDPISTRDFYELGAFFADIDDEEHLRNPYGGLNSSPTRRKPEIQVLSIHQRERLVEIDQQLSNANKIGDQVQAEVLQQQRQAIEAASAWVMVSQPSDPRVVRVLPRGDWLDESGPVVEPDVPLAFSQLDVGQRRRTRLDLAKWLTDPDQAGGLTARAMVNRYWYLFFGRGISSVLDDFGGQGLPPTHPELLDNLALDYVESGWDTKQLVKQLVICRAYRQSSRERADHRAADPQNRLFARQSRYRLPAEMVRDAALTISDLLVNDLGGPSIHPYQPAGLYQHLNFPERKYQHDTDQQQWRRGVYMHWQRQFPHPMLKAFDAPTREECTAKRPRSNTPLAALVLLNDPTFVEAARKLAEQYVVDDAADDPQKIDHLFERATSRRPDDFERQALLEHLAASRRRYQNDLPARENLLAVGLQPVADGASPAELAAWTSVARAVLNLSETTTRN